VGALEHEAASAKTQAGKLLLTRLTIDRLHREEMSMRTQPSEHRILRLQSNICIQLPDHPIASRVFHAMAEERWEVKEFLETAQGCSNFVDLGASGGFFSAVFAATRESTSRILSVEFDKSTLPALKQVRALNLRPDIEWIIDERGVSDNCAPVTIVSTGYGAEIASERARTLVSDAARRNGTQVQEYEVDVARLSDICASHDFVPDLVKLDIEGYEYETLLSSLVLLSEHRPRLHVELHLDHLTIKGRHPQPIIDMLQGIGYKLKCTKAPPSAIDTPPSTMLLSCIPDDRVGK
jgi:FkbM family methyltransferase